MILWRASARVLLRHPWQTVLAVVGVALGVAVVCAVDLANQTARNAFTSAAQAVAGKTTHEVVGGPSGLPEEIYRIIRVQGRFRGCAPVVTGTVQRSGPVPATLQIIGIDPFAEAPLRSFSSQFSGPDTLAALLTKPGTGLMLEETAQGLRLKPGDPFEVEAPAGRSPMVLAGYLAARDDLSRLGLASILVTDIATAQELLALGGRLSRIDLVIPEGEGGERQLEALAALLPSGVTVLPAGSRAGSLERMTRAFRLNLTALSFLALVVGMFLIYNTMTFSVISRRRLIGLLRALGVTRREVCTAVLGEALGIGMVGTLAGLLLGVWLGRELTALVTRTINDLYFVLEVRRVSLLPATLVKAGLLGVGATLVASLAPALEATAAPPRAVISRSDIEQRHRKVVPRAALAGGLIMLAGGLILCYERAGIPASFAGLFAVIIGYALTIPGGVVLLAGALAPIMGAFLGTSGKMSARGVVVSLSRTGIATAALVVAVSATIGVGIMVGSFRLTVQSWLESWLRADVYLRSADLGSSRNRSLLDPALVVRLSRVPGAQSISLSRRSRIDSEEGSTEIFSVELPRSTFYRYRFKQGSAQNAWSSFSHGRSVLISEPYAHRHQLRPGDQVTLRTDRGERSFPVSGVIYDYGSDAGLVIMSRGAYLANWHDPGVDGISFYAEKGVSPERLMSNIRQAAAGERIFIISNAELRRATVAVFDRTFAITGVLRLLTMVVAFVGILAALMALQVERARELAVLRVLGLTSGQVWGVVCGETALIGFLAGLLSLPLGILQAVILVFVLNKRSFGWTMQFSVDPMLLLQALSLSMIAALLAGVYPSLIIARADPAQALKQEE